MPRTPPSHADLQLIEQLAELDVHVSRGQLDRWRQRGLLPRAEVERLGARGSRAHHDERTVEIAAFLGACARRGVAWQALGLCLILIAEPPAPPVLRTCLAWAIDKLELPNADPALSPEERVEVERQAEGPLFRNFRAWAEQSGIKGTHARNELAYALLQERLGDEYGPEEEVDIERGKDLWKAAVLGTELSESVVLYTISPQRLAKYREVLATAGDQDLEAAGHIHYILLCLTLMPLDQATLEIVLRAQTPEALCFKVLETISVSSSRGQTPLDLLVDLVGFGSPKLTEWARDKAVGMLEQRLEELKQRHASRPKQGASAG